MPRKPGKKNPTGKLYSRWVNIQEKITNKIIEEKDQFEILNNENFG